MSRSSDVAAMDESGRAGGDRPLRVAVVGHCAAGKSTLVAALRAQGYDASAVAQEHSAIHWLWRHGEPDVLIYLDASLATIRARRGAEWPEAVYAAQEERLREARSHADLVLDTNSEDIAIMANHALDFLRSYQRR